jgi:hypothetical protein
MLALRATLRIQDSLQAGRSRFYAEITRVRQLVEAYKAEALASAWPEAPQGNALAGAAGS